MPGTSALTRSVTAIPAATTAAIFSGLFVMSRSDRTWRKPKNLHRELVITQINGMSQAQIRFDRIEPLILQCIGAQFFHQTDAAPLLMLV